MQYYYFYIGKHASARERVFLLSFYFSCVRIPVPREKKKLYVFYKFNMCYNKCVWVCVRENKWSHLRLHWIDGNVVNVFLTHAFQASISLYHIFDWWLFWNKFSAQFPRANDYMFLSFLLFLLLFFFGLILNVHSVLNLKQSTQIQLYMCHIEVIYT